VEDLNLLYQEGMQLPFILIKGGGDCHSLLSRGEETAIYSHKDGGRLAFILIEKLDYCHSYHRIRSSVADPDPYPDPDSMGSQDPDPDSQSGSGSRRAKMTNKNRKKLDLAEFFVFFLLSLR
jgi:hypothetical protein